MSESLCRDCAFMRPDLKTWHTRCYSPQLEKLGLAGILVNFERDAEPEEGRSHANGTGKCGPLALNKKQREGV
jgi:hypothetical protein